MVSRAGYARSRHHFPDFSHCTGSLQAELSRRFIRVGVDFNHFLECFQEALGLLRLDHIPAEDHTARPARTAVAASRRASLSYFVFFAPRARMGTGVPAVTSSNFSPV